MSDDKLLLLLKPALNRGELLLHREAQFLELRLAPVGRSLMPDGLLDDLGDEQIRDFFAFLRRSQPVAD